MVCFVLEGIFNKCGKKAKAKEEIFKQRFDEVSELIESNWQVTSWHIKDTKTKLGNFTQSYDRFVADYTILLEMSRKYQGDFKKYFHSEASYSWGIIGNFDTIFLQMRFQRAEYLALITMKPIEETVRSIFLQAMMNVGTGSCQIQHFMNPTTAMQSLTDL